MFSVPKDFWCRSEVIDLSYEAKAVLFYLLGSPHTTECGIIRAPIGYIAEDTSMDIDYVPSVVDELLDSGLVRHVSQELLYAKTGWLDVPMVRECYTANTAGILQSYSKLPPKIAAVTGSIITDFVTSIAPSAPQVPDQQLPVEHPDNNPETNTEQPIISQDTTLATDCTTVAVVEKPKKRDVLTLATASEDERSFVEHWNASCKGTKINQILRFTSARQRKLKNRLDDRFFVDNWRSAIQRLASVPEFSKDQPSWTPSIDWFLKPNSVISIVEGKYDNWGRGRSDNTDVGIDLINMANESKERRAQAQPVEYDNYSGDEADDSQAMSDTSLDSIDL